MGEEALVRGLAQREIEPHLVLRHAEVLAEPLHVQREQRGLARRAQRQADVGRTDHLARQHADGLPDLLAEHRAAHRPHHADQRAGHGLHLLGQHIAHGEADPLRHRVDQLLPGRQGRLDPLRTAPRHGRDGTGGQRRHAVQPQVGEAQRLIDRGPLGRADAGVLRTVRRALRDRLAGDLLGHVPVHRAALVAQHLAELLEGGTQVIGVHRAEHRRERVVPARARPEAERVGRPARALPTSGGSPSSCPRRRFPAPPAEGRIRMGCHSRVSSARRAAGSNRRRLPDITIQRRHQKSAQGLSAPPAPGLRQDGRHLVRTRHSGTY